MNVGAFNSEDIKNIVKSMWLAGDMTQQEIAQAVGKSRNAVSGIIARLGLAKRGTTKVTGWTARKAAQYAPKRKPEPEPAPTPLGPIGDFPDSMTVCRFPVNADDAPFQCCAHPGFPWCEYHAPRVTVQRKTGHTL